MHDALAKIGHPEFVQTELGAIFVQGLHLQTRDRIGNALRAPGGRHIVIGHRQDGCTAPNLAAGQFQALEGLRAGHFMHQMAVDIDQRGAVGFLPHHVSIPEFVVKSLRLHPIPLAIPAFERAIMTQRSCLGMCHRPSCAIPGMVTGSNCPGRFACKQAAPVNMLTALSAQRGFSFVIAYYNAEQRSKIPSK